MKKFVLTIFLTIAISQSATADVWLWTDANGDVHFVDTNRPIYTWVDEHGKIHYADKPAHANAVSVQLVWHSKGTLEDVDQPESESNSSGDGFAFPGETEAEREERRQAEAYYCKRATEIYESYRSAPKLYKTGTTGEREYLSDEEAAQTLSETKAKVDDLCK